MPFECITISLIGLLLTCSEFDGDPSELVLGDEMEYTIKCKNGKVSAETVVKLSAGSILQEKIHPEVYLGKVLRSLRRADPQVCDLTGHEIVPNTGTNATKFSTSVTKT